MYKAILKIITGLVIWLGGTMGAAWLLWLWLGFFHGMAVLVFGVIILPLLFWKYSKAQQVDYE